MSSESKQLVKDSNFSQVELRLNSNYRSFRKLFHIFAAPVTETDYVLHTILFVLRKLNPVWHKQPFNDFGIDPSAPTMIGMIL